MANVTVITSGTNGIGRAIALKILSESDDEDRIIINYGHDDAAVKIMLEDIDEKDKKKLTFFKADMSEYEGMESFSSEIRKLTDHVDWLVLNTGVSTYMPFDEYTYDVWEKIMRTNVNIPAFFTREMKPLMAENGNIVFMGSHAGQEPYSSSLIYSTTKAAVMFMSKSLVKYFEDRSVSVNAVAPGFIQTRWQKNRSEESYERINKKIAKHRFGEPSEVAELVYSILTNDYLNGSIYNVHGGYNYF